MAVTCSANHNLIMSMCFGGILLPRGVNSMRLILSKILKLAVTGTTSASESRFWLVTVEPNCNLVRPANLFINSYQYYDVSCYYSICEDSGIIISLPQFYSISVSNRHRLTSGGHDHSESRYCRDSS